MKWAIGEAGNFSADKNWPYYTREESGVNQYTSWISLKDVASWQW